jgi:glutathione S-transferase
LLKAPEARDGATVARCRAALASHLDFLEGHVDAAPYLAGAFSLADASFIPAMSSLPKCGVDLAPTRPRLAQWLASAQARPSFAASA